MWGGSISPYGYGNAYDRVTKKDVPAHRMMYITVMGQIPKDMQLDHLCRNRACVNPWHLEPVTQQENILRGNGIAARNAKKIFCMRGHPLYGDNLIRTSVGNRACRTCKKMTDKARNLKYKQSIKGEIF